MYKLVKNLNGDVCSILRKTDNTFISLDENNQDYEQYLKWLDGYEISSEGWVKTSEGNTPEPADE